jgi:hypothetical protein
MSTSVRIEEISTEIHAPSGRAAYAVDLSEVDVDLDESWGSWQST